MKKAFALLAVCALVFCIFFAYATDKTSFSVSDNNETYKITASFNKKNNKAVQRVLHRFVKPNNIFGGDGSVTYDGSITLSDKTSFDIKFFPGELKIKMDKTKNSEAAYNKMKKMSEELGEAIK